jgi:hypothetical protein
MSLALGKDDVQLSVQCSTGVLALYEEYCNKVEVRELTHAMLLTTHSASKRSRIRLIWCLTCATSPRPSITCCAPVLRVSRRVSHHLALLVAQKHSSCSNLIFSPTARCVVRVCKFSAATQREVLTAWFSERLDFPLHVMETLQKLTILSAVSVPCSRCH